MQHNSTYEELQVRAITCGFGDALLRLKQLLGVATDRDVAALLGLSEKAFNARKARGSFPEDKLYALAAKRPDLKLDVGYVLTGRLVAEEVVARLDAFPARVIELRGEEDLETFARGIGIEREVLAQLESGRALPTADHIIKLVAAFPERSASWIAGGPRPQLDEDLNDVEIILIRNYRMCDAECQAQLRRVAAAGASSAAEPTTEARR